jgi:hypothetical protein
MKRIFFLRPARFLSNVDFRKSPAGRRLQPSPGWAMRFAGDFH